MAFDGMLEDKMIEPAMNYLHWMDSAVAEKKLLTSLLGTFNPPNPCYFPSGSVVVEGTMTVCWDASLKIEARRQREYDAYVVTDAEVRGYLGEVREVIARGWTQGVYSFAGRHCLEGAIYYTRGHRKVIDIALGAITHAIGTEHIPAWNDVPERTQQEVLALLDRVILEFA